MNSESALRKFPWRAFRTTMFTLRRTVFTSPKPEPEVIVYDTNCSKLSDKFGRIGYDQKWPLSYYYYGEDLNVRRADKLFDDDIHYQFHFRGWDLDGNKLGLSAHHELNPINHPKGHIFEKRFKKKMAYEFLINQLVEWDLEFSVHPDYRALLPEQSRHNDRGDFGPA